MRHNLSEITSVIKDRRTIYPEFYSDRKIHREQIETILNNAIWAPTHGNTQPWKFDVFLDNGKKRLSDFLSDLYLKVTPEADIKKWKLEKLKNRPQMAGAVVAVSMKRSEERRIPEMEEIEAVACAIHNMSLTCAAWGLGSFWSSPKIIYTAEMNEFLNIDSADKCLGLIYIGYVKEEYEWPKGQRRPIEYFTEWHQEQE